MLCAGHCAAILASLVAATGIAQAEKPSLPGAFGAVRPTIFLDLAYGNQSPKQKLDLYLPNEVSGPVPVVIWIHGGAFAVGDKASLPYRYTGPPPTPTGPLGPYQVQVPDVSALTAKGYAVVSVNYRLDGTALSAIQDTKAAVRFLRANAGRYQLDPDRFAVWGNSAGGFAAAVLGTTGDQATPFDDPTMPNPGVSSAVQAVVSWFGGPYGDAIRYAGTAKSLPPFRIVYGDADSAAGIASAQQLQSALVAAGGASTFVLLPGAGHEDPAFMATQMSPTLAFLDQALHPSGIPLLPTVIVDLPYATQSGSEKLDLFLPAREHGPAPTVIWFHGDVFQSGDKVALPGIPTKAGPYGPYQIPDTTALNAQGYAIVGVNYRLGPSGATAALAAVQDGKAAVRFLRAHAGLYNLDPGRMVVWGNSSGGYIAAMLGATGDRSTVFDAPELGNADTSSAVQGAIVWFGAFEGLAPELTLTHYIDPGANLPPFRIVNGDADPVIPVAQAQGLHDALTASGAASTLTILPGAGHEDAAFMATQGPPSLAFLHGVFTTPVVTSPPRDHRVNLGSTVVLSADITGPDVQFQWRKNGEPIPGATARQWLLTGVQPSDAGMYSLVATNAAGTVTTPEAKLEVAPATDPGRLINVSVRIVSGNEADVLIMGFVVGGDGTLGGKRLLIRGLGPALAPLGVPEVLPDPMLHLFAAGSATASASNDDWQADPVVAASGNSVGAFPLTDPLSRDAALVTELTPGVYSVKVAGKNRITGTALAEIYDADPTLVAPSVPRLINLSARATTGNSNPLIAGFVIGGTTARTVLIRAIGPDLTQYVGPAALDDPKLELYVREGGLNRLVAANDDWAGSPLVASLGSRVGAFPLPDPSSLDAALVVTLDPGVYSAKVLGVNNASGITLVEIYEVP